MRRILLLAALLLATAPAGSALPTYASPYASVGAACSSGPQNTQPCGVATVYGSTPCDAAPSNCYAVFDIDITVPAQTCATLTLTQRFTWGSFTYYVAQKRDTCSYGQLGEFDTFHHHEWFGNPPRVAGLDYLDPLYDFTLCVGDELYWEDTVQCSTWTHLLYDPQHVF